ACYFMTLSENGSSICSTARMMEEVLQIELEALTATYADDVVIKENCSDDGYVVIIDLRLAPRVSEQHEAFLSGRLRLGVLPGYPETSPSIDVLDTKGIGDQRLANLRERLQGEASALAGEMALGALCEAALDWATEENHPEGFCAFCLCPLEPPLGGRGSSQEPDSQDQQQLVRLPCYHAFHRGCYAGWWGWRQQSLEAQERELVKHTGASAASVLREQDLPPRDEYGTYETSCPVCRTPAPLASMGPQLRKQLALERSKSAAACRGPLAAAGSRSSQGRQQQQQGAGSGSSATEATEAVHQHQHRLSPQELAAYRGVQARHAAVLARQRAAGGLNEATCYSIAGWTLGADAPKASEQQQEPPPQQQREQQQQGQQQSRRSEGAGRPR
ncbi:hypothetical protein Agub_g9094, partial [Astrephomene gubernaculifera]